MICLPPNLRHKKTKNISIWKVFMCYIILFCTRTRSWCRRRNLWSSRGWLMLTEGLTHWLSTQETALCTNSLPSLCSLQPQARWQVSFVAPPPPLFLFVSHSISAFPQGWINNLAEGPERLTELNKLHWTRELILDFCYYSVAHSILILISWKERERFKGFQSCRPCFENVPATPKL